MSKTPISFSLICLSLIAFAQARAERKPIVVEQGTYTVHMLLHPIGKEDYTVLDEGDGRSRMTITSTSSGFSPKCRIRSSQFAAPATAPLSISPELPSNSTDAPLNRWPVTFGAFSGTGSTSLPK